MGDIPLEVYGDEVRRLEARIKRLEEALRHYSCTSETCDCAPLGQDKDSMYCGYRARAALENK